MVTDWTLSGGSPDITLRDVVVHVQNMGQRLSGDMKSMERRLTLSIDGLDTRVDKLDARVSTLDKHMNERFDALQEDIFAVAGDAARIRRHVGMPVPDDA